MSSAPTTSTTAAAAPLSPAEINRWPRQIKFIIGNEACERFSYYGMVGILAGYVSGDIAKGALGKTEDYATIVSHTFKSVNYFTPLLGAWLSDKVIGRYNTIFWVSLLYCLGHGTLACSDFFSPQGKLMCLYIGLTLIAFGSGGIKPCVSAFMGEQFRPEQSHLMQRAYAAFYFAINFGSMFSFIVIPWMRDHHGYSWAFGVPGIFMAIATFIFWLGRKYYVIVPTQKERTHAGFFRVLGTAIASGRGLGKKFWSAAEEKYSATDVSAARSVLPILFVFASIPMFWALYDQTNSTWVLQANKMDPVNVLGLKVDGEKMQSLNAFLILIFAPLFTWVFYPRMGRFASPLKRMSYGLFLAAASFVSIALLQKQLDAGAHLNVLSQVWAYVLVTAAEVLVSTTGLEFAFREAAPTMKSTIMSFWLLTVAFGNLLVAVLTEWLAPKGGANAEAASVSYDRFMLYAGMMAATAVVFSLIAATYKYRDKAAAMGR
ncbi:MAG TPA: MFS transporter [Verrucomicrobiae bacterium]